MPDLITIKYDGMNQMSGEFQTHSATVKAVNQSLTDALGVLKNGGWMSPSATEFFKTLDDDVLLGIARLIHALDSASQTVSGINATMKNGEQAAMGMIPH